MDAQRVDIEDLIDEVVYKNIDKIRENWVDFPCINQMEEFYESFNIPELLVYSISTSLPTLREISMGYICVILPRKEYTTTYKDLIDVPGYVNFEEGADITITCKLPNKLKIDEAKRAKGIKYENIWETIREIIGSACLLSSACLGKNLSAIVTEYMLLKSFNS